MNCWPSAKTCRPRLMPGTATTKVPRLTWKLIRLFSKRLAIWLKKATSFQSKHPTSMPRLPMWRGHSLLCLFSTRGLRSTLPMLVGVPCMMRFMEPMRFLKRVELRKVQATTKCAATRWLPGHGTFWTNLFLWLLAPGVMQPAFRLMPRHSSCLWQTGPQPA